MKTHHLILVDDGSSLVRNLARDVGARAPFHVSIMALPELAECDWVRDYRGDNSHCLAVAIFDSGEAGEEENARESLLDRLGEGFSNLVWLVRDHGAKAVSEALQAKSHCVVLAPEYSKADALNFLLYVTKLFHESKLDLRLAEYVSDSVSEMVNSELLRRHNREVARLNDELERVSRTDSLTGLLNRGAILEFLRKEQARARRDAERVRRSDRRQKAIGHIGCLAVAMFDLDHFKEINDTHGHLIGDEVLRTFARVVLQSSELRGCDIVGRFGGEEFLVVFPSTDAKSARAPTSRIMKRFSERPIAGAGGKPFHATASAGLADYDPSDTDVDRVIHRADLALYRAKRTGRNQIVLYDDRCMGFLPSA